MLNSRLGLTFHFHVFCLKNMQKGRSIKNIKCIIKVMNPTVRSSVPLIQFNEANNLLFTIVCYIMVTNKQSCYMYHVDSFCLMIY